MNWTDVGRTKGNKSNPLILSINNLMLFSKRKQHQFLYLLFYLVFQV